MGAKKRREGRKEGGREGGREERLSKRTSHGVEIHSAHLPLGHHIDALPIAGDRVGHLIVAGTGEVAEGKGIHQDEPSLPVNAGRHQRAVLGADDDGPVIEEGDAHQVVMA